MVKYIAPDLYDLNDSELGFGGSSRCYTGTSAQSCENGNLATTVGKCTTGSGVAGL